MVTTAGSAPVLAEVADGVVEGAEVAGADGVEVIASLGPGEGALSAVSTAAAGDDADPGCTSRASVTAAAPPTSPMADSAGRGLSRRMPWVPDIPTLSAEGKRRLQVVEFSYKRGVPLACEAYAVSRATVYRWGPR